MCSVRLAAMAAIAFSSTLFAATPPTPASAKQSIPRTANGKPDMQGIWQVAGSASADLQDHVAGLNTLAGRSVVAGGTIPYQPWAAKQRVENYQNRRTADPLNKCYIPGVPRVMYLDFPFQILQTPKLISMAFEWELDYRMIYTDGTPHRPADDNSWMGDSRGHWEGDTLVVDVTNMYDHTWLDMAGDFHSDAIHVVEKYHMPDHDTIQYEATINDPKVFTKPWTINLAFHRRTDRNRLFEYVCEAERQESNGEFTREEKTWYPGSPSAPPVKMAASTYKSPVIPAVANLKRTTDGKPDLNGFFESQARGANQGLDRRGAPGGRGALIVDPPDGKLPMLPWAVEERVSRNLPERGYDDPTAHCFPPGAPRAMWIPEGYQIVQTPGYVAFFHERTAWRIIPLDNRPHLPENIRLWEGDSVGHWEGDTLVIDTTNSNGKVWLNEGGEIMSYAAHVVERITPSGPDTFEYEAAVTDPVVYDKPWTVAFPIKREKFELREAACLEEEHDLPHLKALKDAAAAKKKL